MQFSLLYFCQKFSRQGGCSTQSKIVKNRVGGWVVNLNLDIVFKQTLFGGYPFGSVPELLPHLKYTTFTTILRNLYLLHAMRKVKVYMGPEMLPHLKIHHQQQSKIQICQMHPMRKPKSQSIYLGIVCNFFKTWRRKNLNIRCIKIHW